MTPDGDTKLSLSIVLLSSPRADSAPHKEIRSGWHREARLDIAHNPDIPTPHYQNSYPAWKFWRLGIVLWRNHGFSSDP